MTRVASASRGVIYTAIRARFVAEARVSAASLRRHMPGLEIVLFTDQPVDDPAPFDRIVRLEAPDARPHLDKLRCLRRTPFEHTLFLDTDTYVCGDLEPLFALLAAFDVAMTLDRRYVDAFPPDSGVPDSFCEFNQGVIAYRRSAELDRVLRAALDWAAAFQARTGTATDDQVCLRPALYASRLRLAPLPLEYNCRFHAYGYLNGLVRILHARIPGGRHDRASLDAVAAALNRHTVPRVFVGGRTQLLGRRRVQGKEQLVARPGPTLFRPGGQLLDLLTARLVQKLRGVLRRAARPFTG